MSKHKLVYPCRDSDGNVIESNVLTIPVVRPVPRVRCAVCGDECEPTIVNCACDSCVRQHGADVYDTWLHGGTE